MFGLLSVFGRKPAATASPSKLATREVVLEWRGEDGNAIRQAAQIRTEGRYLVARVALQAPEGLIAQVREEASSYPVEIVSAVSVEGGYEIALDYLWEGRRRQQRVSAAGSALLETDGSPPVQVEVVNVSPGGMKLFTAEPVKEGSPARVTGSNDCYLGFVRHCSQAQQGYHIGVQFYRDGPKGPAEGGE